MFHAIAITSSTNGFGREIEPAAIETLPFAMRGGNVKMVHLLLGVNVGFSCGAGVVVLSLFHHFVLPLH